MEKLKLLVDNSCIINKDFEGSKTRWKSKERSFAIVLGKQDAYALAEQGWNIKMTNNTFNICNFVPLYYIPVKIRYDAKIISDPVIRLMSGGVWVDLDSNNCAVLDWTEFDGQVDIEINGYNYADSFTTGDNCFGFQTKISATLSHFVAKAKER